MKNFSWWQWVETFQYVINFWVIEELVPVSVSDAELVEFLIEKKEITIMRPHARMGANWHRAQGEFFPYIHDFECEDLTNDTENDSNSHDDPEINDEETKEMLNEKPECEVPEQKPPTPLLALLSRMLWSRTRLWSPNRNVFWPWH